MKWKEGFWIGMLTIIFAVLSFFHLGTVHSVNTFWAPSVKTSIVLPFTKTESLSNFLWFGGVGEGTFVLEAKTNEGWKEIEKFSENLKTNFKWNMKKVNIRASSIRLVATSGHLSIGEIGLYDGNHFISIPIKTPLTDEPKSVPQTPNQFNSSYFDEIFYPVTGYELVHHQRLFEVTHPLVGKELMAASIFLFGNSPFAWRLPGALLGILLVPILYLLGKRVFKKSLYAGFVSLLYALSGISLVQSRVATLDIYAAFFSVLMVYFYISFVQNKKMYQILLSGLFFGVALASKWNSLFVFFGIFVFFCVDLFLKKYKKEHIYLFLISFSIIPFTFYVVSYYPISFQVPAIIHFQFWMLHKQISTKNITNAFSLPWWQDILDRNPYWYYERQIDIHGNHWIANIVAMGNPVVYLIGSFASVFTFFVTLYRKERMEFALTCIFLCSYIPWSLFHRLNFSYYFFVCLPFMFFPIVYLLKFLGRKFYLFYFVIVICFFLVYFPFLFGIPVPYSYWISSMRFWYL